MRDNELREERLRKRFELPPFLKHFATNLNLLARQTRSPRYTDAIGRSNRFSRFSATASGPTR
jgi:hypothetical protein